MVQYPSNIENTWNMDTITLNLILKDHDYVGEDYHVIGNCKNLGDWKKTNKMSLVNSGTTPTTLLKDEIGSNFKIFSIKFEVYRGKKMIHYYYMKKSNKC